MNARHVVSLELARRLKDAGFPQDSVFAYRGDGRLEVVNRGPETVIWLDDYTAAPLASEVAEQLPLGYAGFRSSAGWASVACDNAERLRFIVDSTRDTMPDALAALWLALKEERREAVNAERMLSNPEHLDP